MPITLTFGSMPGWTDAALERPRVIFEVVVVNMDRREDLAARGPSTSNPIRYTKLRRRYCRVTSVAVTQVLPNRWFVVGIREGEQIAIMDDGVGKVGR